MHTKATIPPIANPRPECGLVPPSGRCEIPEGGRGVGTVAIVDAEGIFIARPQEGHFTDLPARSSFAFNVVWHPGH